MAFLAEEASPTSRLMMLRRMSCNENNNQSFGDKPHESFIKAFLNSNKKVPTRPLFVYVWCEAFSLLDLTGQFLEAYFPTNEKGSSTKRKKKTATQTDARRSFTKLTSWKEKSLQNLPKPPAKSQLTMWNFSRFIACSLDEMKLYWSTGWTK